MGYIGKKLGIDFVVSTGDNFYENGLKGVDDQAFQRSFTNIYTAKSLRKPWYSGEKSFLDLISRLVYILLHSNYHCTKNSVRKPRLSRKSRGSVKSGSQKTR